VLEIVEIKSASDFARYEPEWQGFLERVGSRAVFVTHPWLSTWLRCFWTDKPIEFVLIRNEAQPVALAPFLVDAEDRSLALPSRSPAGYCDVICDGDKEQVLHALLGHLMTRFKRLMLNVHRIPESSDMCRLLPSLLRQYQLLQICSESFGSPFLRIDRSWSEYLQSRSAHFRSELNRKCKRIEKAGRLEFRKYVTPDQCDEALQDVFHVERNSWKQKNGTSFTAVPRKQEFYADLAIRCAKRGMLGIYTLRLNGEPIAHVYGIYWAKVYHALNASYDESHRDLSPGIALFNRCLRDAFDAHLEEFDFLGDESRWKDELASGIRRYVRMTVGPRTPSARIRKCVEEQIKPFLRAKVPSVVRAYRRLRELGDRGQARAGR